MNAKRILFPTDFSPPSEAAFTYAMSLARDSGASLLILHVEEAVTPYGAGEVLLTMPERPTVASRRILEAIVPADTSVRVERHLLAGCPADQIVATAQKENVDLIVMGTHGRSGLSRLLMGSIAEAVVRRATCPVLTIKQPQDAPMYP